MTERETNLTELPRGWVRTILGDITDVNPKPAPELSNEFEVSFIPMRCVEEMSGRIDCSIVKTYEEVRKGYTHFQDGDLLFAKITPCMENGKVAVVSRLKNGLGFGSTEFHVIRPLAEIPSNILFFFLVQESLRKDAQRQMTGTAGQLRVPAKYMAEIPVPLPPLPEQRRIVAKIEELFTRLDAGVEALKKIQLQLKHYRQSVLKSAFSGQLTAEWRESHKGELEPASVLLEKIRKERKRGSKYKEPPPLNTSDLPELPEEWAYTRIDQICDLVNGRAFKPTEWVNQGIPIIRIQNLNNFEAEFNYCDFEVADKYIVNNGQLLFAWSGTPGTSFGAHIWQRGKGVLNQHIFKVIIDEDKIDKVFLMHLINRNISEYIGKAHGTAGLAHITKGKFDESLIAIPPLPEQHLIAEEIERCFSVADKIEYTIGQSLKQADRLRQSILKEAFKGKLVPQNPNDEPAEKLLERIKGEKTKTRRAAINVC